MIFCTKPRYNIALNETLGSIHCGGVPMSIAVQTDMATPALARWDLIKSILKWHFLSSLSCYFVARQQWHATVFSQARTGPHRDKLLLAHTHTRYRTHMNT